MDYPKKKSSSSLLGDAWLEEEEGNFSVSWKGIKEYIFLQ